MAERFEKRQGFALATLNLDHLVKLGDSAGFREAYRQQDFICADGKPIVWLAGLAGRRLSLVTGSDFLMPMAGVAAQHDVSVALVGSTPEALSKAKAKLEERVPGLRVVATISPPMGFDPSGEAAQDVIAEVAASGAGLCFVALGAPKQEIFAATGRKLAPHIGFASIGAGLDFIAGTQQRAPEWVRRFALEWAWRALSNPRRLGKRYLKCMLVLPQHLMRAMVQRAQA